MGNPGSKVFFNVLQDKKDITLKKLLQWHKEIFEESKDDIAGKLRDYSVKVGDYRAPEW